MKKRILWIFAAILIVIGSVLVFNLVLVYHNHMWKYSAEYEEFADDFNKVKDYIAETYSNKSDKWVSISSKGIFNPETKSYLILPDDVAASLEVIRKGAFPDKDSDLDVIRIHEGRISFCISSGVYALVYSPEQKPKWVNSPNEEERVKVKSLGDGWYHVLNVQ